MSELFTEKQLIRCKKCGIIKERIKSGVFGDGESPRWINEKGTQWNGKLCPGCNRERVRRYVSNKRKESKLTT